MTALGWIALGAGCLFALGLGAVAAGAWISGREARRILDEFEPREDGRRGGPRR